jgi:hypothetical protein
VGTKSLLDLLDWCTNRVVSLIPKKAVILVRQIEQMRSLTTTIGVNVRTVEVLQQGYLIPPVDQHTGVVRRG